jgi:hypothetical protein
MERAQRAMQQLQHQLPDSWLGVSVDEDLALWAARNVELRIAYNTGKQQRNVNPQCA